MPDFLLSRRFLNALGAVACAAMLAFALFSEHVLGLEPCPLCVFQRVAVISLGGVFLMAALHNPGNVGSRLYLALMLIAVAGGAGVAGRHIWLQNLPPDQVPACGPGLDFMMDSFPLVEVFDMVLSGSGECADISWSLLGLSMPAWVLIAVTSLGFYAGWVNLQRA